MWNAVYKKLWVVIVIPVCAGLLAWYFTYQNAGEYKSTAMIQADVPVVSGAKGVRDLTEPEEYYSNIVETMKTEVITSMASYRLLLHDLESEGAFRSQAVISSPARKELFKNKLQQKLEKFELLTEADPTEESIFRVLINADYNISRWIRDGEIEIYHYPGMNLVAVNVSTSDPFLSAFTANALAQEYIRYENTGNIAKASMPTTKAGADSVAFYKSEATRLKLVVDEATNQLATVSSISTSANPGLSNKEKQDRLAELKMRVVEEEWEINNLKDQLRRADNESKAAGGGTASTNVAANAKIQAVRKRIDQLSKMYVEGGRKDQQLDSVITKLRKQADEATARLQASAQTSTTAKASDPNRQMIESRIQRHEEALAKLHGDMRRVRNSGIGTTVASSVNTSGLQRALDRANADYNGMLTKLRAAEGKGTPAQTAGAATPLGLKAKALPSSRPEAAWAALIIFGTVGFAIALCIVVIALTRPTEPTFDERFLRVNYKQRMRAEKSAQANPAA